MVDARWSTFSDRFHNVSFTMQSHDHNWSLPLRLILYILATIYTIFLFSSGDSIGTLKQNTCTVVYLSKDTHTEMTWNEMNQTYYQHNYIPRCKKIKIYKLNVLWSTSMTHLNWRASHFQVGCISYRPPYIFVEIPFIIRWAVSNTDHLIFLLKSPLLFIIYLFIIRWAVSNTDHLIFLLKLPLFIYFS